jgi:hypothetical protein
VIAQSALDELVQLSGFDISLDLPIPLVGINLFW